MKKTTTLPGLPAILRRKQVIAMVGLSASTIYTLEKAGSFPHRVKLSVRAMGWLSADVERWLAERAAERAA
jgi:prophage regulatory protein